MSGGSDLNRTPSQRSAPLSKRGVTGTTFQTNLAAVGDKATDNLFAPVKGDLLDRERESIDRVFSIIDRDGSGSIDVGELEQMFHLFGCDTSYLAQAITKIMSNVDKDYDSTISPDEFYRLLSAKFEKGDSMREIKDCFSRMDAKGDGELDIEEVYKVSQMLGETMTKDDVKEMIACFKKLYTISIEEPPAQDGKKARPRRPQSIMSKFDGKKDEIDANLRMTLDEFYFVMQEEL